MHAPPPGTDVAAAGGDVAVAATLRPACVSRALHRLPWPDAPCCRPLQFGVKVVCSLETEPLGTGAYPASPASLAAGRKLTHELQPVLWRWRRSTSCQQAASPSSCLTPM